MEPPPFIKGLWGGVRLWLWVSFRNFYKKRELFLKMGALTYFHTNQPFSVFSFWAFSVRVCVLFIYNISISIVCVPWEEFTVIESNQQKTEYFLKRKNIVESKFLIQNFWYRIIDSIAINNCCKHITGGVKIYLYGCISLVVSECAVLFFVSMWYQIK